MKNKIIVIDDEQDFLDSIRRGLMMGGYRDVRMVSDPTQALEVLDLEKLRKMPIWLQKNQCTVFRQS